MKIKITLVKSLIGHPFKQKNTVKVLGLKKIGSSVIKEKSDSILGMVNKVKHLVNWKEIEN